MTGNFERYQTDPDSLPDIPMLTSGPQAGGVSVAIHANTDEKVAAWSQTVPGPARHVDLVVMAIPPIFVLTIPFILDGLVLDTFRVILGDQTTHPAPLVRALLKQNKMEVVVYDSSGRSIAYRKFDNDFLTCEQFDGMMQRFPPALSPDEIAGNYQKKADVLSEDAALQRIMEHEGMRELKLTMG